MSHRDAVRMCDRVTMALAKLGDDASFQEIVAELHSKDTYVQEKVFWKLRYIKGKKVVRLLFSLLDDHRDRGSQNDMIFMPLSVHAMNTLGDIVPNPPFQRVPWNFPRYVEGWKAWFRAHPEALQ